MSGDSDVELAIFTEAVKLWAEEREEFIDRACGGDSNLRDKIAALLRAYDCVGKFLEQPPTEGPSNGSY